MKKYDKVLFVSHSDTSRGPMAEAIMQPSVILEDVLIDSKGMIVLFPEPINPKAEAVLEEHGLNMKEHAAVQFTKDDFDERTLILTMTGAQKEKLMEAFPEYVVNLYALTEYNRSGSGDIIDPLGGDLPEYRKCFDILREEIKKVVDVIKEEEESC